MVCIANCGKIVDWQARYNTSDIHKPGCLSSRVVWTSWTSLLFSSVFPIILIFYAVPCCSQSFLTPSFVVSPHLFVSPRVSDPNFSSITRSAFANFSVVKVSKVAAAWIQGIQGIQGADALKRSRQVDEVPTSDNVLLKSTKMVFHVDSWKELTIKQKLD